jgi:hypothetical protein
MTIKSLADYKENVKTIKGLSIKTFRHAQNTHKRISAQINNEKIILFSGQGEVNWDQFCQNITRSEFQSVTGRGPVKFDFLYFAAKFSISLSKLAHGQDLRFCCQNYTEEVVNYTGMMGL